ncbi:hypothetical protein FBY35_0090 [Streptomyces sp. SLBN-118]|uniref:hypothetical protein n=1 Tax=Streptomyces sp. SLBN-118 TaxID=2768454 RepID=UPI0011540454|nr:hypothetical protein [Streptomyces sp. SLBN-118]TQK49820.1 hypothetical protein FBY35_0090 [Streptomyces sp. SLBN-118]
MSDGEWVEDEWDGTLAEGLARRAGLDPSDLASFENVTGRSDLEAAVTELVEALGGAVEYTESADSASEAHLIVARVHLRLRESALKLVEHAVALAVALALLNPGGLVNAVQLVQTVHDAATILSPAEREAARLIRENRRRGITTSREDLAPFGVDVDSLIARGVLADGEGGLSVRA